MSERRKDRCEDRRVILAPSMLSADWSQARAVVEELAVAGCEWLHFDAMDGHFVPNLTMGPMFLRALRKHSSLHFDAHLMQSNAGDYIDEFIAAGADSVNVHVEGSAHLHRMVHRIKDGGARVGVAINPATPPQMLDAILPDLDIVLIMSVNPGFGGQKYIESSTQRVAHFARVRAERGLDFMINVDGGMAPDTARRVVAAGADMLVCGASSVFLAGQPLAQSVAAMREAVNGVLKSTPE